MQKREKTIVTAAFVGAIYAYTLVHVLVQLAIQSTDFKFISDNATESQGNTIPGITYSKTSHLDG